MSRRQYKQNGLVVPYITAWSAEDHISSPVTRRLGVGGEGLGYEDEAPYDRDWRGVLWVRQPIGRGKGRARFDTVHALRQRHAMGYLLCQVCGECTVDGGREEQLFLLRDVGRPVAEGPVCEACAPMAILDCPRLRTGHCAAWARTSRPWGVSGVLYDPVTLRPLPGDGLVDVAYDTSETRWIVASRQVVTLHELTPVNVHDLLASPSAMPGTH